MLQTKKEVKDWLDKHGVENYTINKDLTVDVEENVDLNSYGLTIIPLKFRYITGYLDCSNNQLKDLNWCPQRGGVLCWKPLN